VTIQSGIRPYDTSRSALAQALWVYNEEVIRKTTYGETYSREEEVLGMYVPYVRIIERREQCMQVLG